MKWVEIQGRSAFDDLLRVDPDCFAAADRSSDRLARAHHAPGLCDGVLERHLGGGLLSRNRR